MTVSVELRTLHYLARAGALSHSDRQRYDDNRADLLARLLRGQASGYLSRRRSPRVPRALGVRMKDADKVIEGVTLQLSSGGFSMYLAELPTAALLDFALALPDDTQLTGKARIVGCVQHGKHAFFACLALVDPGSDQRARLEDVVLDATIENSFDRNADAA